MKVKNGSKRDLLVVDRFIALVVIRDGAVC